MFKLKSHKSIVEKVTGIFTSSIQYEVRAPDGNWSPYFGLYQNQKWGEWDSNSCWCLSAINCVEDQLEWLYKNKMFSQEAMDFFTKNGYIDSDGDFSLSERFIEIISGVSDNGNNQMEAWRLMQIYGCIPRSDCTYSKERADVFTTKAGFNRDYFDEREVTQEMYDKGKKFLTYVNISRQWLGSNWTTPDVQILRAALKQSPLQIGIPVPVNVFNWNSNYVSYDGKVSADHAVELYGINTNGDYLIFDQYQPNLKVLSKNYLLPMVTQGIVNAVQPQVINPITQPTTYWQKFWTAVYGFFNGITPQVPIGSL